MVFSSRQAVMPSMAPVLADNFADNSWADIILACQTRNVPETWTVGSQKAMYINDRNYAIDIIGINHDEYSDGSGKAPLTFQMHGVYSTSYPMGTNNSANACGWTESVMRTTHLPAILDLVQSEVQAAIKEVNKKASTGEGYSTIETAKDKLFLLSEIEIFGKRTYSFSGEGSQYAYYANGGSKEKDGVPWWTRSPRSITCDFCQVSATGTTNVGGAANSKGVAFAFCF